MRSVISTPARWRYLSTWSDVLKSTTISHGFPGSYGATAVRSRERGFGGRLDHLPRPRRRELARAEPAEALLHGHGREAVAEQSPSFAARGLVAGDEHDRTAPGSAERGVDPGLAHLDAVEPQPPPRRAADRVREHTVARAGHGVHADEERSVDAALEVLDVLRPFVLHDELAVRVELFGNQRVERPALTRAVTVHDDDLRRAGSLRAAHGRVDLAGVEAASLLVHRVAARHLLPLDDPGDALHVADDEDLHDAKVIAPTTSLRLLRSGVSASSSTPST